MSRSKIARPLIVRLAAGLTLVTLTPMAAVAQLGLASAGPVRTAVALANAPSPLSASLSSSYRVRLTSTWPQQAAAGDCRNGGEEVLEGTLMRSPDGTYAGTFTRRTELLFCGAHRPISGATAAACALTLSGRGSVDVIGVVTSDASSPSGRGVQLTWVPVAGHEVTVTGACAPAFKSAMQAMYLTTPHAAEFALTTAGTGPRSERLEDYAWKVELE